MSGKKIDIIHNEFHGLGDKVINAVKQNNYTAANRLFGEAEKLSQQMLSLLDRVESKIKQSSRKVG